MVFGVLYDGKGFLGLGVLVLLGWLVCWLHYLLWNGMGPSWGLEKVFGVLRFVWGCGGLV